VLDEVKKLYEAKEIAKREIAEEDFEDLVDREKAKLRNKRPIWEVIFPFKFTIERIKS